MGFTLVFKKKKQCSVVKHVFGIINNFEPFVFKTERKNQVFTTIIKLDNCSFALQMMPLED